MPVLKARKKLKSMAKGDVLEVQADDPVAIVDFPHFCHEQGHQLVSVEPSDEYNLFIIEK